MWLRQIQVGYSYYIGYSIGSAVFRESELKGGHQQFKEGDMHALCNVGSFVTHYGDAGGTAR